MAREGPNAKDILLVGKNVRRWYENLGQGSEATADVWLRRLRGFQDRTKLTPVALLEMTDEARRDLFLGFVGTEVRRGSSGPYIAHTLAVVSAGLRFNHLTGPSGVKIRGANRVHEETPLSPEQLRALLNAASPRERVAV